MEPFQLSEVKPPASAGAQPPSDRRTSDGFRRRRDAVGAALPGLAAAALLAVPAIALGRLAPTVGGPVFGILAGAVTGPFLRRFAAGGLVARLRPGYQVAGRQVLQASVVVLGTGLPLRDVLRVGTGSLPVMLGTLAVALGGARLFGRLLGIHPETRLLVGVGTGICGASAIAAVTAVVGAAEARVAYALGTIFTFNIAAVLLFPLVGHLFGLSQHAFGLWSGTAINDTSSVVAAAYGYGTVAGAYAVVVKLTRSLMIVPICAVLQIRESRRRRTGQATRPTGPLWRAVPLFVVGFLAASAATTLGGIPASWAPALSAVSLYLMTTALTGIGLSLDLSHIRTAGIRPLALGAALWVAVSVASIGLQVVCGQL